MIKKLIEIDNSKSIAKYRQIINSIILALRAGLLNRGDKLPSVNEIAREFNLSRDTVLLAFNELKARGIIQSVAGKGYYVESTNVDKEENILVLFDEFNAFKEDLYNAFVEALGGKASVDIFFHHFNPEVFASLVSGRKNFYTSYVIMPANLSNVEQVLSTLPQDRIFLLDRNPACLKNKYPAVFQEFHEDMYEGLKEGLLYLKKYQNLVLVFPGGKEPEGFLTGFKSFCHNYGFTYEVMSEFKDQSFQKGNVYVIPDDRDLVRLVRKATEKKFEIGADIGVISLNDTGLKEIVAGGITTLSTDFFAMGKTLARLVLSKNHELVKNPSKLNIRNSL